VDRLGALLLVCVSCLIAPFGTFAQRSVTLVGYVYCEEKSHAPQNVHVDLRAADQAQLASVTTADDGQFRFDGLKQAVYTVSVNEPGFEPVTISVDLSGASQKNVAIYLKRSTKAKDSPKSSTISTHELSMPAKARDLMESGKKKLYQDKNSAGGLDDFQQAISLAPGYYEAHYQLAMAYLSLGNTGEAEKSFRTSITVSGDKYGEADVRLGAILLDQGNSNKGEKAIRRGLQLSPNFWLGHYELGRALLNQKRIREAQDSAEHARLLAPGTPIVYRLLANIHLQQKDYPALLQDIDEYLTLDPNSPAGLRAKELRDQIAQKMATDSATAAAKP
jgi:tetratricopeptide (TPR) repeat protein